MVWCLLFLIEECEKFLMILARQNIDGTRFVHESEITT